MADNSVLNSGSGGDTIATDDISGVKYPRSKVVLGADGVNDGDVCLTNPMPVAGRAAADAALAGNPIPIAGRASAAAPTAVSADDDVVIPWLLRNGSFVVNMAVGGTLVTGSAGLPVAQQGTWTVTVAQNDPAAPRYVQLSDGASAITTLPVSLASVPSHAVTNAGTFVTQIDGAALTALQLIDNPVVVDDAAFTPASTSVMMAGFTFDDSTPDTVNEGDAGAGRMSANRCQYMVIRDNAGNERGLNIDASGYLTANINGTLTVASHAVTNAGTFAVQVDGSALTALQVIDNPVVVDDAAFTPATTSVMMAGFQADESSTDSVDEGDGGAARMTLDRKVIVTVQPHTKGGCSIFRSIDIDESEEEIKASAGQVYGIHAMNLTAALLYLKFYNATAANVTVGTTTPVLTFPVPGNGDTDGAGFTFSLPQGMTFDTAISVACTTGVADADTGAPAANACVVNVFYM